MSTRSHAADSEILKGERVAFVGKLAGMPKREAQQLVRASGGATVERLDDRPQLIVVGEAELPLGDLAESLGDEVRAAVERGEVRVITETQLWQRLGFVEGEQNIHRLYTPAMLADLLGVSTAIVRRWHRRGLIRPVREVRKLPYFDFQQVAHARRLAELLAAGVSPQAIEKKLASLRRLLPEIEGPLAQLSVIVEGKQLLLRQGDGLIDSAGQLRFDFEAAASDAALPAEPAETLPAPASPREAKAPHGSRRESLSSLASPAEMRALAAQFDDEGDLEMAAEMYRAALAAGGPDAETCFLLAEMLYRLGDLSAARERYYMAVELDEDYVEARANLGCVLAETQQHDLAAAAFAGALAYHPDYADAHYHLARTLDELGRRDEAEVHWRAFLDLTVDSPWALAASQRLSETQPL
ncbi:MAG TPA: tetratricopeptide repeat protein [Pirellulales bacterium]|nr:tetratricopeptide repeat protein [Pirellulales bacterium]